MLDRRVSSLAREVGLEGVRLQYLGFGFKGVWVWGFG